MADGIPFLPPRGATERQRDHSINRLIEKANGTATGSLLAANNLSDLTDASAARDNLGVSASTPGGRITLTSGVPVMTSDVAGATTVYYAPYVHQYVPLYDGTSFAMVDTGGQLSQATTDTTKSPAAVANSANYDLFVWDDAGTIRCTRGPAWSSGTSRGTGAGTTELERVQGVLVNKIAITNGPAAQRGTYVGTIRSNGSAQIDFVFGGLSAGATMAIFNVWNCYNRRLVATRIGDTTVVWTYATAAWRAANNSSTYRVYVVIGLEEVAVKATHAGFVQRTGSNVNAMVGVGVDSVTAFSGTAVGALSNVTGAVGANAEYAGYPGIGTHYISAIEYTNGATATYYGAAGVTYIQSGLVVAFEG